MRAVETFTKRSASLRLSTGRFLDWLDRFLNHARLRAYAVALGLPYLAIVVFGIIAVESIVLGGDFLVYYSGGYMVLSDDVSAIYNVEYHQQVLREILGPGDDPPVYLWLLPPFVALVFAPLAFVDFEVIRVPFIVAMALLLLWSMRNLWNLLPDLRSRVDFPTIAIVAFSTAPVVNMLASGQTSAIALSMYVGSLLLLTRGRDLEAGALLGVGVYKPQLFLAVPILFLLLRRWRALGAWFAVSIALALISMALVGTRGVRGYLDVLSDDTYNGLLLDQSAGKMLSIPALVRYFVPMSDLPQGFTVLMSLGAVAICGSVLFLAMRGASVAQRNTPEVLILAVGLTIALTVLMSPHMFEYDGVLLIFPALVLLGNRATRQTKFALVIGVVLLNTMFLRDLILGDAGYPLRIFGASWVPLVVAPMVYWLHVTVQRKRA